MAMAVEQRAAMDLMRRGASFLVSRKLALAFQSWLAAIEAAGDGDRKKVSMSRALLHLLHRELSRGWVGWHAQLLEAARKRTSMSKSLLHLLNRKQSAGWTSLVAMAMERRAAVELMRRGASFLGNRKLAPAFQSWLAAIEAAGDSDRKKASMSRALLHLLHRELSRGWVGWHAQWLEAMRKRDSASRSLLHLLNRKQSAGWTSLVVLATERREAMDLIRRSLQFLVNRKLAPAFLSWLGSIAEAIHGNRKKAS
eukprot:scaffold61757_cov40-Phaeocystis_antarctica.AAC.2